MQFCDSHCHLGSERFANDRPEIIARALQANVTMMVTCGSDLATSATEAALAAEYTAIYAAVGIHGHQASSALLTGGRFELDESVFGRLAQMAVLPGVVALGELGLDYHYEFSPRLVQQQVLERQLALAQELGLPVILHNRESDHDLMRIVDGFRGVRGVLHCFLGDHNLRDWALEHGLYLGVAGPLTFPKMEELAAVLRQAPLNKLLVETDAPYLAPRPFRGQRNEPCRVTAVTECLSRVLEMPLEQVAELTFRNACACFGVHDAA